MPARDVRILVVGHADSHLETLLQRLANHGWRSYGVESYAEAQTVFRTLQFDVVLAREELADGRGFQLSQAVASRSASLFVEIDLSEGHLWLPAVEYGKRTLGERALDPAEFEAQLVELLSGDRANHSPRPAPLPRGDEFLKAFPRFAERDASPSSLLSAAPDFSVAVSRARGLTPARRENRRVEPAAAPRGLGAQRTSRMANRMALTAVAAGRVADGKEKS